MKKKVCLIAMAAVLAVAVTVAAGIWAFFAADSQIPKLYFEGDIAEMYEKSDLRNIQVRYEDGERSFTGYAELKVQGTSSLMYDKKNYTIKFYQDQEHEEKLKVDLGWGAESKYCLKANWIDRTHARNVVTAKLASQVQAKYAVMTQAPKNGAVDGFPVEIYSNGFFLGLYTFNIPKDEWQFGMDGDDPDHIVIGGEGWEAANLFQGEPDFATWAVEVGQESDATLEKMKALFDFVMNSSDEAFQADFEKHLDLDSALNYYVMADFAYLPDNLGKNMLIATYDGQVWYLSLYDLDTSWGTSYNGMKVCDYVAEPVEMSKSLLFQRMLECFPQELAQRYFELREEILTKEHILGEFEAFRDQIPEIVLKKEYVRWGSGLNRRAEDLPGFDYDQIEEYLDYAIPHFDAKYAAMLTE